jgi:hypothetical protein
VVPAILLRNGLRGLVFSEAVGGLTASANLNLGSNWSLLERGDINNFAQHESRQPRKTRPCGVGDMMTVYSGLCDEARGAGTGFNCATVPIAN